MRSLPAWSKLRGLFTPDPITRYPNSGAIMRLALDTRTPLVQRLPDLEPTSLRALGRKHVCVRQRFLAELLGLSYERRRPHSLDREADSFDREFLVRGLRVSPRGKVYTRLLKPFYLFPE